MKIELNNDSIIVQFAHQPGISVEAHIHQSWVYMNSEAFRLEAKSQLEALCVENGIHGAALESPDRKPLAAKYR